MLYVFFWMCQILTDIYFRELGDAILYWWSGQGLYVDLVSEQRCEVNESERHGYGKSIRVPQQQVAVRTASMRTICTSNLEHTAAQELFLRKMGVIHILYYSLTYPRTSKEVGKLLVHTFLYSLCIY